MEVTENSTVFMEEGDVVLRPVEKDDAEFIASSFNHPDVRHFMGRVQKPMNIWEEEKNIEEAISSELGVNFLVEYRDERAGLIMINHLDDEFGGSNIGYFVCPEHQNKGVGTKALKMAVRYIFETLNRHKIRTAYLEGNKASRRIMEKAGFREMGKERHYKYVDGEWKDVQYMSILESEYYED